VQIFVKFEFKLLLSKIVRIFYTSLISLNRGERHGGRNIVLLESSLASPARPSDKYRMRVKALKVVT
jgi:hypothetical protein